MANITFNANSGSKAATKNGKRSKSASSAKKKSRSGKKVQTEAVRYLRYELTNSGSPGTETSHYIDLARDLSAINRRLMRQGRAYHVKRISVVSSNTIAAHNVADLTSFPGVTDFTQNAGRITFATAPTSWVSKQAWKRGFKAWTEMQNRAMKASGLNPKPTWNDFKIYLSNEHRTSLTGQKPKPKDNGGNDVALGEWDYAEFVSPDGTTGADSMFVHLLGAHVGGAGSRTAIGLIQSYGDSRATVNNDSPTVKSAIDDDPIFNLFDDGTVFDEIVEDMRNKNDGCPYNLLTYPGDGVNQPKPMVVQQTTLGADGRASVGGFTAMCGLMEVEITSPIANDVYSVLVELAPGNYRGIAADVI